MFEITHILSGHLGIPWPHVPYVHSRLHSRLRRHDGRSQSDRVCSLFDAFEHFSLEMVLHLIWEHKHVQSLSLSYKTSLN